MPVTRSVIAEGDAVGRSRVSDDQWYLADANNMPITDGDRVEMKKGRLVRMRAKAKQRNAVVDAEFFHVKRRRSSPEKHDSLFCHVEVNSVVEAQSAEIGRRFPCPDFVLPQNLTAVSGKAPKGIRMAELTMHRDKTSLCIKPNVN